MADTVNSMTDNIAKTTTHVTDVINQSTNYYNNFVSPIPESIHINYDYKQVDYQQIKKEFAQDLIYATTVAIIPFEIKNTLKSINNLIHRQATISLNQK